MTKGVYDSIESCRGRHSGGKGLEILSPLAVAAHLTSCFGRAQVALPSEQKAKYYVSGKAN